MLIKLVVFLLSFIVLSGSVLSQPNVKYSLSTDSTVNRLASMERIYFATRTERKPKLDGRLTDLCWEQGDWASGFVQQIPNQGKESTQKTLVKIVYDSNNIYVGFKCFDTGKIRSILSRRDNDASAGDIVGIAFDSYNDNHTAYEFNLTAAGQKIDMVHLGSGDLDYNWDAVWDGKVFASDSVWTAEMQIPFNQLRFSPGEKQVWGVHLWRWIDRNNEYDHWKLIPVDAPSLVYLFGELKGIEGVKPRMNREFLPYVSSRYMPNTDQYTKMKYGVGINGKVGLNSGLTLDYAINPDFGQIEADPAVLNLTSYETFNEEKRPFFLEGNTVFDYSIGSTDMLYYSRRIGHEPSLSSGVAASLEENEKMDVAENVPILSALKLTGKTKKGLSVGVLQSFTAKEQATIYGSESKRDTVVEPFTSFLVGRIKQDLRKGNTVIGGMITSTMRNINDPQLNFLPKSSLAGGIDIEHNWKNRKYFVEMKSFFSDNRGDASSIKKMQLSSVHYFQRPDAKHLDYNPEKTELSGWGGYLSGGKRSGRFRAIGTLNWRSPSLDFNDVGYLYQADLIQQIAKLTYKVNQPTGILRSYYGEFTQQHEWSWGFENTLDRLNLHGYAQFKNLWLMHLNLRQNFNIFDTRELRGGPKLHKSSNFDIDYYVQTNAVKKFYVSLEPKFTLYSDGVSKASYLTTRLQWQVSNRWSIVSTTVFSKNIDNDKYADRIVEPDKSLKYFVGMMTRNTISSTLRIEYSLTPEISFQYYGNPYVSIADYENFRQVNIASAKNVDERYIPLQVNMQSNGRVYLGKNSTSIFNIKNPDVKLQEFNSNFVARWEFKPGSTLYFVWTNTRSQNSAPSNFNVWKGFGDIWNVKSENAFMIKLSYWFSL